MVFPAALVEVGRRVEPLAVGRLLADIALDANNDLIDLLGDLGEALFGVGPLDLVWPDRPEAIEGGSLARAIRVSFS